MNIKELEKIRHEILKQIKDEMTAEFFAVHLNKKEKEEDAEILRVLFDELGYETEEGALGEFAFLPVYSEEEKVQYFSSAIIIADTIVEQNLSKLYEAMSTINFYIQCGAFCIDKDKQILAYKMTTPLPIGLSKDALYEQVNICMGNSVAVTDQYCDLVLRVNAGVLDIPDMLKEMGIYEEA